MKKKTLVIIYWDLGIGGIQKRIRDLTGEISRSYVNWNVFVLLRAKSDDGFDGQAASAARVTLRYYPFSGHSALRYGYLVWVARQIIQLRPDVILTFHYVLAPFVVLLTRLLWWIPAKVVINEGVLVSKYLDHRHAGVFPFLIRLTYPCADTIIVPTHACEDDLIHVYCIPGEKISVIANWTCLSPMKPLPFRFDCLYVGRFSPEKNPTCMIAITNTLKKRNKNVQIGMMGSGELLTDLLTLIAQDDLASCIHMLPFTQDVASVLRRSKVLVVPSIVEGMPNVILEAAICSVPAVINRFPGVREVVRHGITGYVSETDEEVVTYIDHLLTHERERKRMGTRARQYVEAMFSFRTQKRFIDRLLLK